MEFYAQPGVEPWRESQLSDLRRRSDKSHSEDLCLLLYLPWNCSLDRCSLAFVRNCRYANRVLAQYLGTIK